MKKLRKVKTNLQDSIEAYEGACTCFIGCNCVVCDPSTEQFSNVSNSTLESTSLSISLSHYNWA